MIEDSFLLEEVRSDYLVTIDVKKLWAVELDLLEKFKDICKKYNLTYFAAGGTLLGAARHKGFIPWDDDIDIHMLAEDYQKFLDVAPAEIGEPYFLQSYKTDPLSGAQHARLRRSDTTACTGWEKTRAPHDYNRGIFIDIFPLFNVPESRLTYFIQCSRLFIIQQALGGYERQRYYKELPSVSFKQKLDPFVLFWKFYHLFFSNDSLKEKYIRLCSIEKKRTKLVSPTSFIRNNKRMMFDRKLFDDTVELQFENTTITCPKEYDLQLTTQYGDWHKIVKNCAIHEMAVFDADTPYYEKLK